MYTSKYSITTKATKADLNKSIAIKLVFVLFFIGIPTTIIILTDIPVVVTFFIGIFIFVGILFLLSTIRDVYKYFIKGEPYEYYIVKNGNSTSYVKGNAIGLPNSFSDLTHEQNNLLAQGICPGTHNKYGGYNDPNQNFNPETDTVNINSTYQNNQSFTEKDIIKKTFNGIRIFQMFFALIFIIIFGYNIISMFSMSQGENINGPIMIFIVVFLLFLIIPFVIVIKTIKSVLKKNTSNTIDTSTYNQKSFDEVQTKQNPYDDDDDPFASYYNKK